MTYEIEIKKIPENEYDKAELEYIKKTDEEFLKKIEILWN